MKYTTLIWLLFVNALSAQQPCTVESIMAVKGKWIKHQDANMKASSQQVISRIDKMQQLVQAAYPEPMGIEAAWYRSMGGHYSSINNNSTAYDLNALFKTYYCNTNLKKLLPGTETGNWFYVWANKFSWFAEKDEYFLIENKPTYLLPKKIGELNGFSLFAGNDNGTSNTGTRFSKTILISRTGQWPFAPVSRKQYLLVLLKNKEDEHKRHAEYLLKMPVWSDTEEEANKQKQLKRLVDMAQNEQSKERVKANFLKNYKTAKQRHQEDITRSEEIYRKDIKAAQDYLNNSADEELAKPAYIENNSYRSSFLKFGNEKEGRMLVQVNTNYFNNKLPAYAPQFLVVYWSWNTEKPSLDFANHIENNFDFKALQTMLDK